MKQSGDHQSSKHDQKLRDLVHPLERARCIFIKE